jgi:hypothetical protein
MRADPQRANHSTNADQTEALASTIAMTHNSQAPTNPFSPDDIGCSSLSTAW